MGRMNGRFRLTSPASTSSRSKLLLRVFSSSAETKTRYTVQLNKQVKTMNVQMLSNRGGYGAIEVLRNAFFLGI